MSLKYYLLRLRKGEMSLFCVDCGARNDDSATFCHVCGKSIIMKKMEYIQAFVDWNKKRQNSMKSMIQMLFINAIFSGVIYLLAGVVKVNMELSLFKWVSVILCIFLVFLTIYMLFNFEQKRAGINLFYAITFFNMSISCGGIGLYNAFFSNKHSLNNNILLLYIISYFTMLVFGFIYNHLMIIKGKYDTAGSPRSKSLYLIVACLGIIISTLIGRTLSDNLNSAIATFSFIFVSFLILIVAANCFLRWYYILRYKV